MSEVATTDSAASWPWWRHPIKRTRFEAWWIRRNGLGAWLTWATMDEASGKVPLRLSARFWRKVLG